MSSASARAAAATTALVERVTKLVAAGGIKRPRWLHAVAAVPPVAVVPVATKPPKIVYPEDAMRRRYFQVFGRDMHTVYDLKNRNEESPCERLVMHLCRWRQRCLFLCVLVS